MKKNITIGEKYRPAMEITDQVEADAYFEMCVEHTMRLGKSRQEAEEIERVNLGYYADYYDHGIMARVNRLFHTEHPLFGKTIPTAKEAFEIGLKLAEGGGDTGVQLSAMSGKI